MATLLHGESRRLYSWWWDSHISPKNSKWLQENLTDMDVKVKAMIKLLEEDADSFARRAEMYYKKRPELMKLVEEFYRAYRALAERYDHATGALRQAHRTMAEAFPNQIPLVLSDEATSTSPAGVEPHTPEMPPPIRALFDPDDLQKDALGVSSHFHAINRNGGYSDESDSSMSKKGLKQLNEMFETGEGAVRPRLAEGRVRKGLIFHEEAIKGSEFKRHNGPNELQKNDLVEKEAEIKYLQEKLTQLSTENHDLESQVTSETGRADKAQAEVQSLTETLSIVKSEKEAALVQHQSSLERISSLEAEIARLQEESKKLNDEMIEEASKLSNAEQHCLLLEKECQSVLLEFDRLKKKSKSQELELGQKHEEIEKVNGSLKVKQEQHMKAEIALQSMGKLLSKSEQEVRQLALEVQANNERLNGMEQSILVLKEEVKHLKTENCNLHEQNHSSALLMRNLQDEITHLKETKVILKDEVRLHLEEKKAMQQEVDCLKEVKNDLEQRHHYLAEELKAVSSNTDALQKLVKELKEENGVLKKTCKKHKDEQSHHLENLRHLEKLSEKNSVLQVSLSDAQVELEGSKEKLKILQSSCDSLHGEIAAHVSEKAALVGHMDIISQNMEKTLEKNTFLENSLSDVNAELESLRERLKGSEESWQALSDQHSNLLSEKNSLFSQVESLSLSLGNKERSYAALKEQNLILEKQTSSTLNQLRELENILKQEKQEHQKHIQSSMRQQATLEDRIYLLQESAHFKEEEFVVEQERNINNDIKILILCKCLSDLKESNSYLHTECQKHLKDSIDLEKLISHLQQEDHMQKEQVAMLYKDNEKLRQGMHLLSNALTINGEYGSSTGNEDKELLEIILAEIRSMLDLISDAQYENQHLHLEKLVITTLLHQLALELANTRSERDFLEQQHAARTNELLLLQNKTSGFLELNEQLRQEVEAANEREKAQKDKLDVLSVELSDREETHQRSQVQIDKLVADNLFLSKRSLEFENERALWEEEINAVLVKVMEHEVSHLIFRSILAETVLELKLLLDKLDSLRADNNDFGQEIGILNKKLDLLEVENMHLKEQVICLEECERRMMALQGDLNKARNICEQQVLEIEYGNYLLISKETELLVVYQILQEVHLISQEKICNLIEENHSMKEKLHALKEKKESVEEENNILIQEFIAMECLYVRFKCLYTDMASQLKLFNDDLLSLHSINSDLNQKIRFLDEKLETTEVENLHLKVSVFILEECRSRIMVLENDLSTAQSVCKQLNHQIEAGKFLFAQKEAELLEESQKARDAYHSAKGEICTLVEDKRCLWKNLHDLKEQMDELEQENAAILAEAAALDCLYSISTSLNADNATELKLFSDDLDCFHVTNYSLEQEVKTLNDKIGKLEEENSQLWESKHHLEKCRSQLQDIVQRSEGEIDKLFEENQYLLKKFNALMVKSEVVEEDNAAILAEAMTLDFLQLIFKSLNAERAIELESFSNDLKHLHTVKSKLDQEIMLLNEKFRALEVENVQLKVLVLHLEECRSRIIILENELNATRITSEQLRLQVEAGNKPLIQKNMDLSEANQRVLSMKDKIKELCQKTQELKLEIDEDKMVREELEKKNILLLESNVCKDKEIVCVLEASKLLEGKFYKLQEQTEDLRSRERLLTSELQKKSDEIKLCEQEIVTLSTDAQVSTLNAAILEEKLMEIISACESLEIGAIMQREMLDMEMIKVRGNLDGLKQEMDELKGENTKLQGDLKAYTPLAAHLLDGIASLEQHVLLLKELSATNSHEEEDNPLMSCKIDKSSEGFRKACQTAEPTGMLELQESLDRIEALQRVILETKVLLEKKMISASANTEAEMTEAHKELEANKDFIRLIDDEDPVINLKWHEDDAEVSKPKYGQVMKDIQLDKVSSSSLYGNGVGSCTLSRINNAETDDQMLELWETAERDCNNQMRKESSATIEQDIEYHEIEAVEEEKSEYPSSELMAEKELSIDKLELPSREPESYQEWKTTVTEKLLRDAQRLSALQTGVQEVKRKLGTSEKSKHSSSFKHGSITVHLKEVEEAVVRLTDSTNKLIKKSEDCSNHAGREEEEGIHSPGGRQLVQRGRRASEKIARLELELQKIQYIMLKLEEEQENRRRATSERKSSVLLRDYLYGRREGNKNKRGLCRCMRPKTNGD